MATVPSNKAAETRRPPAVVEWVAEITRLTQPDHVHWCDGAPKELQQHLRAELVARGEFIKLNQATFPDCYLYRSDPTDVARVEHLC